MVVTEYFSFNGGDNDGNYFCKTSRGDVSGKNWTLCHPPSDHCGMIEDAVDGPYMCDTT